MKASAKIVVVMPNQPLTASPKFLTRIAESNQATISDGVYIVRTHQGVEELSDELSSEFYDRATVLVCYLRLPCMAHGNHPVVSRAMELVNESNEP